MQTRAEWLAERKTGIGGSDSAAIAGLDPFKTAYHVALDKLGQLPDEGLDEKDHIIFGNAFEDVVAREYARRNNVKVRRINSMVRSKEHPFMFAHYDRDIVGVPKRLEVKTSGNPFEWGKSGTNEVPDRVIVQCMHYLAVEPSLEQIDVALLLEGQRYRQYDIVRDQKLVADIIELDRSFWTNLQNGKLPDPTYDHRSTAPLLAALFPGTDGSTVAIDMLQTWHDALTMAQEKRLSYEKLEESLKNHIRWAMGNAAMSKLADGSMYRRKQVDRKAYTVEATSYMDMRWVKEEKPKVDKAVKQIEEKQK